MSLDILNHIRYGVEKERAQMGDDPLNEGPGLWNQMWGGISGATKEGVESKKQLVRDSDNKRKYGVDYRRATGNSLEAGMSEGAILDDINRANKATNLKDQETQALQTQTIQEGSQASILGRELARSQEGRAGRAEDFNRVSRQQDLDFRRDQLVRDNNLQVMQMGLLEQAEANKMHINHNPYLNH